jgi:hypothetical protein
MQKREEAEAFVETALNLINTGLFFGAEAAEIAMVRRYLERMKNEISRLHSKAGQIESVVSAHTADHAERQGNRNGMRS